METLYFMVVAFVMQNPLDIDRPLFVYYEPHFKTYAQCHSYVQENNQAIYAKAVHSMGRDHVPESIYCLNKSQVKEMHDYTAGTPEKKEI